MTTKTEYLLYGLAAGETERYREVMLLSNGRSPADVERVKTVASKDGWHSFRTSTYNGEAPDFSKITGGG